MRLFQLLLFFYGASAQQAPIGIIRGELVKCDSTAGSGRLHVRTREGHEYECGFDRKTYFERDNQMVAAGVMTVGERVEILSDRKPGSQVCYARTVHVMDSRPPRLGPGGRPPFRTAQSPTESFAPRGSLTFAGIVVRVDPGLLTLRTRSAGEVAILLRQDTRYIGDGQRVDAEGLKRNTHVFVRAGRNLDDDIEAYQVVWGTIVQVR